MDSLKARRAFLRGRSTTATPVRPPWTLPEQPFLERCTRCNDCIKACPTDIIVTGDGGFPTVDFSLGACTFCGECVDACAAGAFDADQPSPWHVRVDVSDACLAKHDIFCMACVDACPEQAIRLHYASAVPIPDIHASLCTGCGGCVATCPSQAISLHPHEPAVSA